MARYDILPSEFDAAGARIGIVAARFNDDIVSRLLEAALDTLACHGLDSDGIPVARVPGAFELPLAARWLATRYGSLTDTDGLGRSRERRRIVHGAAVPGDAHIGGDSVAAARPPIPETSAGHGRGDPSSAARGRRGTATPDDERAGEDSVATARSPMPETSAGRGRGDPSVAARGRRGTATPDDERAGGDGGLRGKLRTARNVMIPGNATADAVIALGAVIRGDTPHFDYVCAEAARGIRAVSLELDVPIIFGVLTCDDHVQALERAGGGPAPSAPSTRGDSADLSGFDPSNPDISDSAGHSRPAATGSGHRNKGREAALAALEMVSLRRRLGA